MTALQVRKFSRCLVCRKRTRVDQIIHRNSRITNSVLGSKILISNQLYLKYTTAKILSMVPPNSLTFETLIRQGIVTLEITRDYISSLTECVQASD